MADAIAEAPVAPPDELAGIMDTLAAASEQPDSDDEEKARAEKGETPLQKQENLSQPESPVEAKKRMDTIHNQEAGAVAWAVLKKKSEQVKITDKSSDSDYQLAKYNNIRDLANAKDGPASYRPDPTKDEAIDYFPLDIPKGSKMPLLIEKNGEYLPCDFTEYDDENSIEITAVVSKQGDTVTCKTSKGKLVEGIKITFLADAQMHNIVRARDFDNAGFTDSEKAVIQAYDSLAIDGKDDKIRNLYLQPDAKDIRETARNNGFITAESVRKYLDKIYAPIEAKAGEQLTPDQEAYNEKLREKRAAIILKLNLDARVVADTEVMVGVVTQTMEATLDNLTAAINSETDPEIRKLYEDTLTTLSNPDNQKKLPDVMTQVMENLSPDFAMAMNKSLETGDVKGLYTELIKKFPAAEKLKEFDSKITDKILVGGLGIMAILAALLGTVAAAGMKPAR